MIPQTTDIECQEYLNNELLASSEKPPLDLKAMTDRLIEEAGNMQKIFNDEDYVCEISLNHLEVIIGMIRQYKNEEIKS